MRMDRVAGHVIDVFAFSQGSQYASENIVRVGLMLVSSLRTGHVLHRPVRGVPVIDILLSTPLVPLVFFTGRCAWQRVGAHARQAA